MIASYPARVTAPAAIADSAAPRRMTLRLLRDIDVDTLYGTLRDGPRDDRIGLGKALPAS